MLPDLDGRQRLQGDLKMGKNAAGEEWVTDKPLEKRWEAICKQFVAAYHPRGEDKKEKKSDAERLEKAAKRSATIRWPRWRSI